FGKITAPIAEGSDGYATANSEKGQACDLNARALQNRRAWPLGAGRNKFFIGFIVPGDQDGWNTNCLQNIDANRNPSTHVGIISSADDHIDGVRQINHSLCRGGVGMQVAE